MQIGCHHCRGSYSLKGDLHKGLIEYRLGTIVAFLDENYDTLIKELAQKLPQGREGQAVVWKNKKWQKSNDVLPENLFIQSNVDRQDLIGKGKTYQDFITFIYNLCKFLNKATDIFNVSFFIF